MSFWRSYHCCLFRTLKTLAWICCKCCFLFQHLLLLLNSFFCLHYLTLYITISLIFFRFEFLLGISFSIFVHVNSTHFKRLAFDPISVHTGLFLFSLILFYNACQIVHRKMFLFRYGFFGYLGFLEKIALKITAIVTFALFYFTLFQLGI